MRAGGEKRRLAPLLLRALGLQGRLLAPLRAIRRGRRRRRRRVAPPALPPRRGLLPQKVRPVERRADADDLFLYPEGAHTIGLASPLNGGLNVLEPSAAKLRAVAEAAPKVGPPLAQFCGVRVGRRREGAAGAPAAAAAALAAAPDRRTPAPRCPASATARGEPRVTWTSSAAETWRGRAR